MKYYELWITLCNWKRKFSVEEFRSVFVSPDPNKVLHDMVEKGFLERIGWGEYRVVSPRQLFKKRTDIRKSYEIVKDYGRKYAFTREDAVFIWTKGGYQADRFDCFYPIHIKVREKDLEGWKSFFKTNKRMFFVSGESLKKTFFGVFYVLYPESEFKAKELGGFKVVPLKEAVEFCRRHLYTYEPALEMLGDMYGLGIERKYKETKTNM